MILQINQVKDAEKPYDAWVREFVEEWARKRFYCRFLSCRVNKLHVDKGWWAIAFGSGQSPIASYRRRRADAKHESQHAYCNKSIAKQIFLEVSGINRQIFEEIVSRS